MESENGENKKDHSINSLAESKQKKKGNNLIVLFIAGFIFLIIFVAFVSLLLVDKKNKEGYKEGYKKEYVHTEETPSQIIKSSREAMKKVKTAKFDGEVEIGAAMAIESQVIPIDFSYVTNLAFAGYADRSDSEDIKTQFNLNFEIDISSEGGSEEMSLNVDCIDTQDNFYYKLNDYDLGMMGMMLGGELKEYKGKWLMAKSSEEKGYDSKNDFDSLDPEKIGEIYAKYELLEFEKDLGDEKLGNIETYHYKVKFNSADFAGLVEELQLQTGESSNEKTERLLVKVFKNIDVELWIGKRDKFLYQVKISGNYDTEDLKQIVGKAYGEAEIKREDGSIKSEINLIEERLKSHYKYAESYDDFVPFHYAKENVITDKNSYAIWKEMTSTTDKWCIDSTGRKGYVQGEIKDSVCPKTSLEPQGEKRNYEEYAYNFFSEQIGPEGKIEIEFDLNFSLSEFNKPLKIEKPKDVEETTRADDSLFNLNKDALTVLRNGENENNYENEDLNSGYVMGASASVYNGIEKIFELFDSFQ